MDYFEELYTWARHAPYFSEEVGKGGEFLRVIYLSISKLSFYANFQTFSTPCSEIRAVSMTFDFAEIRSQIGKV